MSTLIVRETAFSYADFCEGLNKLLNNKSWDLIQLPKSSSLYL